MSIPSHLPAIKPSPDARLLYNQMVAKSNGDEVSGRVPYLSLEKTVSLRIDRQKQGRDIECSTLLYELVAERWVSIDEANGGWRLSCSIK